MCFFLACAHNAGVSSRPASADQVSFNVTDATDHYPLSEARVFLVSGVSGMRLIGVTEDGVLDVPKHLLNLPDTIAVLFCHEWFFCGALRIKEDNVTRYDDYLIELAPFSIY